MSGGASASVRLEAQAPPVAPASSGSVSGLVAAEAFPLSLEGIHKRWRKDQAPILDGVDLRLDLGTKTWIGGRNGAGKTTLLRIAAGLIDPDQGRVHAWGFGPHDKRSRYHRLVAFLPAGDRGLYARLSVRHQLRFWAGMAMIDSAVRESRVEETIDAFDLRELADQRVDRMSMGQRQRVRIAMTFLPEPETVLLDEPLTSLDLEGAVVLDRAIDRLIDRGGALLWCSPSGDHPEHEFDSDWLLEAGRLVAL
ncbi:MAG TPA: ABC transporter ATP-binding protein [Solirubrobacterales bacterium]|jgi:ABC-2 type transport system ATP-binding protein|nr:ABC transporter ATP-binding protein [Solirubrobacterales bacterium]